MKYEGYKRYGTILGKLMADFVLDRNINEILSVDLVVPVPLWKYKEKKRGFNQSALLAEEFCKNTGLTYCEKLLIRKKETSPQNGLDEKQRYENLRGAFKVREGYDIYDKAILIIDDIYTSGSTVFECAKALLGKGAKEVIYLALSSPGPEYDSDFETEDNLIEYKKQV